MTHSSITRLLVLPFLLSLLPLSAVAENSPAAKPAQAAKETGASSSKGDEAGGTPAEVLETMSNLVEAAVTRRALIEVREGREDFLPYGVMLLASGETRLVSWQKPNPPPALDVLRGIFAAMQRQAMQDLNVVAVVTVAPSGATTDKGEIVRGVRCEIDHRKGEPRIVFIPYMNKDGKISTGSPVYLASNNPVFPHPGKATAGANKASSANGK